MGPLLARVSRRSAFVAFNLGAVLLALLFVIAPLVERFSDRADNIAQARADLARQQAFRAQALAMASGPSASSDPFLPGPDYSTADADLQQILKMLAGQSGVRFVGVRSLGAGQGRRVGRMVTARLDVEGSLSAIGGLVQTIEAHSPCLFIGGLTMRTIAAGAGSPADSLNAQLSVLSAFKEPERVKED